MRLQALPDINSLGKSRNRRFLFPGFFMLTNGVPLRLDVFFNGLIIK